MWSGTCSNTGNQKLGPGTYGIRKLAEGCGKPTGSFERIAYMYVSKSAPILAERMTA